MEKKFTIKQRITLANLLGPVATSAAKRKIINDTLNDLSLSESEIKDSGYTEKVENNRLSFGYHPAQDPMKEFNFGEVVCECLSKELDKLDKQEKLDGDLFSLWKMFVAPEEETAAPEAPKAE